MADFFIFVHMTPSLFIQIGLSDIIDILMVAFLIYTIYKLVKGTVAINIFLGIVSLYFVWKLVGMFQMRMLQEILGQFISVGVIALIVVFQQEIRKFLLMLGRIHTKQHFWSNLLRRDNFEINTDFQSLTTAIQSMSKSYTGALIVIKRKNDLTEIINSGVKVNAILSAPLIETIFFKNSPLHDGAVIINHDVIEAARCVLPLTQREDFPPEYGLRHRAATGLSQQTDSLCIIVSEQTGHISYAENGVLTTNISIDKLTKLLHKIFSPDQKS